MKKKLISIIIATCLLSLAIGGCSKSEENSKDKEKENSEDIDIEEITEDVTDVLSDFLDSVKTNEITILPDDATISQESMINTLLPLTDYEIDSVEATEDSATATVIFTMPDVSEISAACVKYEGYFDLIGTIETTTEKTLEFDLTLVDDDWTIDGSSADAYADMLIGVVDSIEFARLTADEAMDAFDLYMNQLSIESSASYAVESTDPTSPAWSTYLGWCDSIEGDTFLIYDFLSKYFSRIEYEATVTEATNESVTLQIVGTAPESVESIEYYMNNVILATDIYENLIEWQYAGGTPDRYYNGIFGMMGLGVYDSELVDYNATVTVTVDDDGNYIFYAGEGFLPAPYTDTPTNNDTMVTCALDNLLERGTITQEQHDTIGADLYTGNSLITEIETGDDYYVSFTDDDDDFRVCFWTRESHDPNESFTYNMSVNGESVVEGGTVTPEVPGAVIHGVVIPEEYCAAGNSIDLTIYGTDGSSILAHLQIDL